MSFWGDRLDFIHARLRAKAIEARLRAVPQAPGKYRPVPPRKPAASSSQKRRARAVAPASACSGTPSLVDIAANADGPTLTTELPGLSKAQRKRVLARGQVPWTDYLPPPEEP